MIEEFVTLVDECDQACGTAGKLDVHRRGQLHRAVSVFLFDRQGRMLLQRRAQTKYHSKSLWANTCCGHPRPGERPMAAARRRLREELGIDARLKLYGQLTYRARVSDDMIEWEYVHLFTGLFDGRYRMNPDEVSAIKLVEPTRILKDGELSSELIAPWFKIYLERFWPS